MDLTQLLVTVVATLGIALVGVLAVVPTVMEARAAAADPAPSPPAPTVIPRRPARRRHHLRRPADLAA